MYEMSRNYSMGRADLLRIMIHEYATPALHGVCQQVSKNYCGELLHMRF